MTARREGASRSGRAALGVVAVHEPEADRILRIADEPEGPVRFQEMVMLRAHRRELPHVGGVAVPAARVSARAEL